MVTATQRKRKSIGPLSTDTSSPSHGSPGNSPTNGGRTRKSSIWSTSNTTIPPPPVLHSTREVDRLKHQLTEAEEEWGRVERENDRLRNEAVKLLDKLAEPEEEWGRVERESDRLRDEENDRLRMTWRPPEAHHHTSPTSEHISDRTRYTNAASAQDDETGKLTTTNAHANLRGKGKGKEPAAAALPRNHQYKSPALAPKSAISTCTGRSITCGPTKKRGLMRRWIKEDNKGAQFIGIRWVLKEGRMDGKLASSLVN
ncbi:hypothetical protein BGX38DRAFT_1276308 [Terfezia claveryi]|nr:hypothetical protein BGX38DRAFT_1276308 [Terfezia claveryi]